jgi:putative membrane protein
MRLSEADHARIETAVDSAERRTNAEFAVVIAPASDDYGEYPLLWAAVAALLVGGVVALVWANLSALTLFLTQAALFLFAATVMLLVSDKARLAPRRARDERVDAMADLQFAARVANRTRDAVGVLLFVSLAEHVAEVRVDQRIAAVVPDTAWQTVVAELTRRAQAGDLAAAVIAAVEACAAILAEKFPPVAGQTDEIRNRAAEL